jgi:glycogen debranching enzyme
MVKQLDREQTIPFEPGRESAQQAGVVEIQPSEGLPVYQLSGDGLSMGASFGNNHCWITTKGRGDINSFFSTDLGRIVMGAMLVRCGGLGAGILPTSSAFMRSDHDELLQLLPDHPGTIVLHPAYQQHSYQLPGDLHVRQTIFVTKEVHAHECAPQHQELAAAYQRMEITNRGSARRSLRVYGFVQFRGDTDPDIQAQYDKEHGVLLAHNASQPKWVRYFGTTVLPTAYETSADAYQTYRVLRMRPLSNHTDASGGYVLGGLQVDLDLAPGGHQDIAFVQGFSANGQADALAVFNTARDVDDAQRKTIAFYERALRPSEILTPDPVINSGVLWAKVNMLRVMADYPTGPAFTNDPSRSSAVVGRDAFWMVHGADYLAGEFSCPLLRNFATRQEPKGEILEFYDAVTGKGEDDGLNINDNTPLFIMAVHHHWRTTGHRACLEEFYPAVVKAARYIISQENEKGLVWCTSTDVETRGIIGWRNIIPGYRISGAVTEVNVECAEALRTAGQLAETLGHKEEAKSFRDAGVSLTKAINQHLLDPRSGFYYLNIDVDGSIRTDVTADEVFPVIWNVAPPEVAYNIVRRINAPDFFTEAGVRTASTVSAEYDPGTNWGLLGGVWPGMTWWYAFAASRYHPGAMAVALHASFAHYAKAPAAHNTVPGQFSEWFDGDSLVNRGMRLSPWEAPRYLWAAVEGACGVFERPDPELPQVAPKLPVWWSWIGARNLPFHGRDLTYFAARLTAPTPQAGSTDGYRATPALHIFATGKVEPGEGITAETYERDVSDRIRILNTDLRVVALERQGEILLCVGNTALSTTTGAAELDHVLGKHSHFDLEVYNSELGTWLTAESRVRDELKRVAFAVETKGFRIARLRPGK